MRQALAAPRRKPPPRWSIRSRTSRPSAEYRRDLVRAVTRRALERGARMSGAHPGLRHDLGRPLDPAARGPGAGDRATAASPPTCRRRSGCASCAARSRAAASTASGRRTARWSSPPPTSRASSRSGRCCTSSTTCRSPSRSSPTASCASPASRSRRWSPRARQEAEDIAEQVELEIDAEQRRSSISTARSPTARARCTRRRRGNVIVEGRVKTAGLRRKRSTARRTIVAIDVRSRRQNAMPLEARAAHAAFDPRTGRVTLTCSTQMPHMLRTAHRRLARHAGDRDLRVVAPDVGGGFGQKMSLSPEYVAAGLARAQAAHLGRLDRGSAREPDRRLHSRDQRSALRRRLRRRRQAARARRPTSAANVGAYSCYPTTCGGRAADGDGRVAGPLRRARLRAARARRASPTPARWRPIAACRGR